MAGRRTSIYLREELEAAVKASGLPIAELIRRGLGTAAPERAVKVPASPGRRAAHAVTCKCGMCRPSR
jgi:hypothetical protein